MPSETCRYRFDPEEWEANHDRPASLAAPWRCGRGSVDGEERCRYHLDPEARRAADIDDADLREALVAELEGTDEAPVEFVGATFGSLDLTQAVIEQEDNRPIDLRHATVDGDLDATQATLRQPVKLDEATIRGDLDLSDAELSETVSFAGVEFEGRTDFENTRFGNDVSFAGTTFAGEATFERSRFDGSADFYDVRFSTHASFEQSEWRSDSLFQRATFDGKANFLSVEFRRRTDFRSATFDGAARFSRSVFGDDTLFVGASFEAEALFKKTRYDGPAYYQDTCFGSEASFSEATFADKSKFRFAQFHGEASISYADFDNSAYFPDVTFHEYAEFFECSFDRLADFRGATFEDTGRFMKATFADDAYFDRARFASNGDFRSARFDATAYFRSTTFQDGVAMHHARFAEGRFVDIATGGQPLTLDLEESTIEAGEIVQSNGDDVAFDLRGGTVGNVGIDLTTDEHVFDRFLISRTDFDGFDFSNYRYALAPEWTIHRFTGESYDTYDMEAARFALDDESGSTDGAAALQRPAGEASGTPTDRRGGDSSRLLDVPVVGPLVDRLVDPAAGEIETTYLKAKNGASSVGDSRAASKFFIKEMRYRRESHLNRALDPAEPAPARIRSLGLAVMNYLLSVSCGYGEKPHRTLLFSALLVLGYQFAFASVLPAAPYGSELGYLLLSIQSFTSLVIGNSTTTPGFLASFVAATEGFLGAFLIGLFVFTLTRSIHR